MCDINDKRTERGFGYDANRITWKQRLCCYLIRTHFYLFGKSILWFPDFSHRSILCFIKGKKEKDVRIQIYIIHDVGIQI